jgi:phosphohistidine phosphatase SixA
MNNLILLIRHGEPVSRTEENSPLTDKGRRQARDIAEQLAELGLSYSEVHHSPSPRTTQTAQELAAQFAAVSGHPAARLQAADYLAVHGPILGRDDIPPAGEQPLVLVTHEPKIRALVLSLTRDSRFNDHTFEYAQTFVIERPTPGARLGRVVHCLIPRP